MTDQGPVPPPVPPQGWPQPAPVPSAPPVQPAPQFAAPYAAPPVAGYAPAPVVPAGSRTLGAVALVLALLAAVVAPIVGAVAAWRIAAVLGVSGLDSIASDLESSSATGSLDFLIPVRGEVLTAEIAFWSGTVLGIWAIVQAIIAVVKRRGRGLGTAAIVVAAVGPFVYFLLLWLMFVIGAAVAASGIPNA